MKSPREVATSLVWNYAGRILDSAGMYVVGIVIARSLDVREYGLYALFLSGMQMVLALSSVGMEVSLNRFLPGLVVENRSPAIRYLVRNAAVGRVLLACIAAGVVAAVLNVAGHQGSAALALIAFSLFAVMRSVIPLLAMSMVAQLRTRTPATISIFVRITDIVVIGSLAAAGGTFAQYVIVLACTSALHVVALLLFLRPSIAGPVEAIPIRPILTFGAIFWINVIVDFVLGRYGDVVLLGILGPDKNQTGLYEVGAGLVQAAGIVLTTGMGGINLALFSEIARQPGGDGSRMKEFYRAVVRISSALTLPLMVFLLADGETVIRGLYTDRFMGALFVVRAFAGVRILGRLFGGGENTEALLALGKVGLVSTIGAVAAGVNLIGDILLIPVYGAEGAVFATSTAYVLVTCCTYFFVRRHVGARLQPAPYLRLLAGSAVGALALLAVPALESHVALATHMVLFVGVTLGSWALLKPFRPSDIEIIGQVNRSLGSLLRSLSPRVS